MERFEVSPGIEGRLEVHIDESTFSSFGRKPVALLSGVVGLIEQTALRSVEDRLPQGFTTVGYDVDVRSFKPPKVGAVLAVRTLLSEVRETRLVFDVSCFEGKRLIASGTHKRAIVPLRSEAVR